jgi:hypothetical protein
MSATLEYIECRKPFRRLSDDAFGHRQVMYGPLELQCGKPGHVETFRFFKLQMMRYNHLLEQYAFQLQIICTVETGTDRL